MVLLANSSKPPEMAQYQDYLEKYKKFLNLKRDAVLQKHGSQYSINSTGLSPCTNPTTNPLTGAGLGQAKVSPSAATAPLAMN